MRVTRIGGPTVLVELDNWRILVDPTFDPPGRTYEFGLGASSTKTRGPALQSDEVGPVDVILLSHDHHADNLDEAGRSLLPEARHVVTTHSGARRLRLEQGRGLTAGESLLLVLPGKQPLRVTATPARHGPPLSRPLVGDVVGFLLRRNANLRDDVWFTGAVNPPAATGRAASTLRRPPA